MKHREVVFYKTKTGKKPVKEFIDEQLAKIAAKILWVLKAIEELEKIPESYFKNITGTKFYECRITFGGNIYRILGFFHKKNFIVLTNGFQKKIQKTPKSEIDLCKSRMKDYLERGEKQ